MTSPDPQDTDHRLTVFFDGACPVCSREVDLYKRRDRTCAIQWHDVSVREGEGEGDLARDGASRADALARLHARLPDGRLVIGVDAFIAIWRSLPGFRLAVPLATLRPIRWLLDRGYDWYAPRRTRLTGPLRRA